MFDRLFERYRLQVREARFVRLALLLSLILNVLTWGLALWFVIPRLSASPLFALHYTVYFGPDRLGPAWGLLRTPFLGAALLAVNFAVTSKFYRQERLVSAFFGAVTILFEALLFVLSLLSILLNL
jgi:hypothetical protein